MCVDAVFVEVAVDLVDAGAGLLEGHAEVAVLVDVGGKVCKNHRGCPVRERGGRVSTGITHDGAAILKLVSEGGREERVCVWGATKYVTTCTSDYHLIANVMICLSQSTCTMEDGQYTYTDVDRPEQRDWHNARNRVELCSAVKPVKLLTGRKA